MASRNTMTGTVDVDRPDIKTDSPLCASVELHCYSDAVLGERNRFLLTRFGRVVAEQYSGAYVSGIPTEVARAFVYSLVGRE